MNKIVINSCNEGFEISEADVLVVPCKPPLRNSRNRARLYFRVKVDSNEYGKWEWFLAIVPKDKIAFNLVAKEEEYDDICVTRQESPADIRYVRFYLRPLGGEALYSAIASQGPNCKSR